MNNAYLETLDIGSHERRKNTAARKQCVKDIAGAFAFLGLLAASVAATGWLVKHYLL